MLIQKQFSMLIQKTIHWTVKKKLDYNDNAKMQGEMKQMFS